MAGKPEGAPIWVDASFPDIEAAKRFYGEVLGWSFGESAEEFGGYTQAFSGGKKVAGLAPKMPEFEGPSEWCLYFSAPDIQATTAKVRENGGQVIFEPMAVGDFGSMMLGQDPGGVTFGLWQPGTHQGFETTPSDPGAFCWAEITTRTPEKSDAFFPAVFSYETKGMCDSTVDYKVYNLNGETTIGRMAMDESFPPDLPSYINVYFSVADCDAALATVTRLGGQVFFGPMDTPFGRFAAVGDPQGQTFSVIDTTRTEGEMPKFE